MEKGVEDNNITRSLGVKGTRSATHDCVSRSVCVLMANNQSILCKNRIHFISRVWLPSLLKHMDSGKQYRYLSLREQIGLFLLPFHSANSDFVRSNRQCWLSRLAWFSTVTATGLKAIHSRQKLMPIQGDRKVEHDNTEEDGRVSRTGQSGL